MTGVVTHGSEAGSKTPSLQQQIRLAAMNLLARREHARRELEVKLSERFAHCEELVDEVLQRLQDQGLLSDDRFAEAYVVSRLHRGQGKLRMIAELKQKGVSAQTIQSAFEEAAPDWFALAREVLLKRFGADAPVDMKDKAKRIRFLQQRGFGGDEIRAAMAIYSGGEG